VVRALRPRRGVPAVVAALVLLACGGLVAAEVVSALAGRPLRLVPYEQVAEWASRTAWQDRATLLTAGATAAVGVLLILIAVVPGRPRLVALRTGDPDLVAGVPRSALARMLAAAASDVDGVREARARVRGRRVLVAATTGLRETTRLTERVRAAVEDELGRFSPVYPMSIRTRVRGVR
jgi:hypothetical protein